jgi:hypothetical protein
MQLENKDTDKQPDDLQNVNVTGHLLIRDFETKLALVNQRGSAKNTDVGDMDD